MINNSMIFHEKYQKSILKLSLHRYQSWFEVLEFLRTFQNCCWILSLQTNVHCVLFRYNESVRTIQRTWFHFVRHMWSFVKNKSNVYCWETHAPINVHTCTIGRYTPTDLHVPAYMNLMCAICSLLPFICSFNYSLFLPEKKSSVLSVSSGRCVQNRLNTK